MPSGSIRLRFRLLLPVLLVLATVGRDATAVGRFERIVSLAPNITETLFSLGLGESVVGITDFCDYPPEAAGKRSIGGFINPDIEAIIDLNPDLIIATRDGNRRQTVEHLRELGFRVRVIETGSLEDVFRYIEELGEFTGVIGSAAEVVRGMKSVRQRVAEVVRGAPRPRVMFVYSREPLILAGNGSYAGDLIGIAGGDNIAADSRSRYPRFDLETVLARAPEVIIMSSMDGAYAGGESTLNIWSDWPVIPAVRDGRIGVVDPDLVDRPGPRLMEGLMEMARLIHPDLFEGK